VARKPTGPKGPTPVESITHADKRKNIPTADAQEFVTPQVEQLAKVTMQRDASLDPQLIWRGKYPDDDPRLAADLVADAPPIYIQEKIDPRVLIENLRRTAKEGDPEPELTLFEDFDGLDELDAVDFYAHDANWSNRMILGDSLQVMTSLAEREDLRGKVQMIYIDPPYGIKFGSNWQVSARKRSSEDGKMADAVREVEQIKAFRDTWELGIHSYLSYLRDRLVAARELLTESGSCFVQIGDENVHLVRAIMDEVFGSENMVSTIHYMTTSGRASIALDVVTDSVLWYANDSTVLKYRNLWRARSSLTLAEQYSRVRLADGSTRTMTANEKAGSILVPDGAVRFMAGDMSSSGANDDSQPFEHGGVAYSLPPTHIGRRTLRGEIV